MTTFAEARKIVEQDVPGGARTASYGYESDKNWFPIILPERLGGRVPGVSKQTGNITWMSSLEPEYADSRPWGSRRPEPRSVPVDPNAHLPGLHDQKEHGRRGPRKATVAPVVEQASKRGRDRATLAPKRKLSRAQEVERAREHLDSIVSVKPVHMLYGGPVAEQRELAQIREGLAFQAQLTPKTAMTLTSVGPQPWWDLRMTVYVNAAYSPEDRSIGVNPRWGYANADVSHDTALSVREGFNTPHGASSQLGSTIAHEFGHHVMRQIYDWQPVDFKDPESRSPGMPMDVARRFMGSVSRALKVDPPDYDAEPDPAVLSDDGLNAWYENAKLDANKFGVSAIWQISGYAAQGGLQEFFAEVWREYSTRGRKARTMVKQIGAAMAREAELNAAAAERAPVVAAPVLVAHLPGQHNQKDHGRRYGPDDVRPTRKKAKPAASTTPKRARAQRKPAEPPPLTPQQEAMRTRREPTTLSTPRAIRQIYGARLRTDESELAQAAVAGLADIPEPIHRIVRQHMESGFSTSGIYLTSGQMVDFVPEARRLAEQKPRGYPEGKTWRDSGGVYMSTARLFAVGTARGETASEMEFYRTAQHELGHALDHALGHPSETPQWIEQARKLGGSPELNLNPYFSPEGNPAGWEHETFAQAMRGWADGLKQRRHGNRVYSMLDVFGYFRRDFTKLPYEQDFDPQLVEAAQYMIEFFDRVAGVN